MAALNGLITVKILRGCTWNDPSYSAKSSGLHKLLPFPSFSKQRGFEVAGTRCAEDDDVDDGDDVDDIDDGDEDDDVDDGDEDDNVSYESQNLSKPVNNLRAVPLRVRVPAGLRQNSWAIDLHRVPLAIFLRPLHWNSNDDLNNKAILSDTISIMTINKLEHTIIGLKRENPSWNSLSNNLWQQGDRLPW